MPACLQDGLSADRLKLQCLSVQAETSLQVELSAVKLGGQCVTAPCHCWTSEVLIATWKQLGLHSGLQGSWLLQPV